MFCLKNEGLMVNKPLWSGYMSQASYDTANIGGELVQNLIINACMNETPAYICLLDTFLGSEHHILSV